MLHFYLGNEARQQANASFLEDLLLRPFLLAFFAFVVLCTVTFLPAL